MCTAVQNFLLSFVRFCSMLVFVRRDKFAGRAPRSIPQLEAAAVEGAADPRRLRRLVTMSVAAPPSAPIRASGRCPTESAEIQAAMAENAVLMT